MASALFFDSGRLFDKSILDNDGFAFTDLDGSVRDQSYTDGFRCYQLDKDTYRFVPRASDCTKQEFAIAEDEFQLENSIVMTEWLYEHYLVFKHSYTVLVTAKGEYYITEKNRYGLMWYKVSDYICSQKTNYSNYKGTGSIPDSVRYHSKWHDGASIDRTTGILHKEWQRP